MLVTLKDVLKIAEAKKCAIGSFNTPNMTSLRAVIDAAEECGHPVIVMHAQIHDEMGICKLEDIAPVMLMCAERAKVPVCVHLDHGTELSYVKKALDYGFTSVMYDGSELDAMMNIINTSLAVKFASRTGASVEAEIGSMGAREGGSGGGAAVYTEPGEAKSFVENTGIDALACAFGTAHGIYLKQPKLDFARLAQIKQVVNVPLVMHGGSGVSEQDYRRVIELGVRKINYYTYMSKAGGKVISHKEYTQFHDAEKDAYNAMKADAMKAIKIFALKDEMPKCPSYFFGEESQYGI